MASLNTSPQPPKFTDNVKEDSRNIFIWAHDWFRARVMNQRIIARLDKAAAIALLTQTISDPPTKTEVDAIQEKINALITALK